MTHYFTQTVNEEFQLVDSDDTRATAGPSDSVRAATVIQSVYRGKVARGRSELERSGRDREDLKGESDTDVSDDTNSERDDDERLVDLVDGTEIWVLCLNDRSCGYARSLEEGRAMMWQAARAFCASSATGMRCSVSQPVDDENMLEVSGEERVLVVSFTKMMAQFRLHSMMEMRRM